MPIFLWAMRAVCFSFSLAWFLVSLSQGAQPPARPVTMIWIMIVPLFDTTRLLIRRLLQRRSPFSA